jgi:hypothetical protein
MSGLFHVEQIRDFINHSAVLRRIRDFDHVSLPTQPQSSDTGFVRFNPSRNAFDQGDGNFFGR